MLALVFALALPQGPPQPRETVQPQEPVRPTLVRVFDGVGRPLEGAHVVFVASAIEGAERPRAGTQVIARTDAQGRARVRVPDGPLWSAWAAWDGKEKRLASTIVTHVAPGRPLRLTVQKFEAFRVRWLNIEKWRAKAGPLSTRFTVHPGFLPENIRPPRNLLGIAERIAPDKLDGFQCGSFELPAPASAKTAVRLPPLPLHSYYAVLTDAKGNLLDLRYMNPAFHSRRSNSQVQHLYERKLFLKQLSLGKPVAVKCLLRDQRRQPVKNGEMVFRTDRADCEAERHVVAKDDAIELLLPYRKSGQFGAWKGRAVTWAPDCLPALQIVSMPKSERGYSLNVRLARGRALDWRIRGHRPGDRLVLETNLVNKSRGRWTLPIRIRADGTLALPATSPQSGRTAPWDLCLLRDGRKIPLWVARGEAPPASRLLDLSRLATVELLVQRSGRRPRGGVVAVFSGRNAKTPLTRRQLGQGGRCRVQLMPGSWFVTVRCPRIGDGHLALEVGPGAHAPRRVELKPYRVLSGIVSHGKGQTVAHPAVTLKAIPAQRLPLAVQHLILSGNRRVVGDEKGHFEAFASSRAVQVQLSTTATVNRRSLRAQGTVTSLGTVEVVLELGTRASSREW